MKNIYIINFDIYFLKVKYNYFIRYNKNSSNSFTAFVNQTN